VKRLLPVFVVVALALPAASVGARENPEEGTLSVKDATGRIMIRASGGFIGRFDRGSIRVIDPIAEDGTGPVVSGAERSRDLSETTSFYSGTKVRFRLIGGKFRILIVGTGVDLSVVGHGTAVLDGRGGQDGRYSFNGGDYTSVPDFATAFDLVTGLPTGL
jgi:hypothetical protein